MPTLELIEENSDTCPVTESTSGVGIPLLLVGAVCVIAIVGIVYASSGSKNSPEV